MQQYFICTIHFMLYWTKVKTLHYNILYFVRQYWTKLNVFQTSSKRFVEAAQICLFWCLSYVPFCVKSFIFHGNSLCEAVWSRKIHVQIMRFTCCLNMAFTWKSLNWALICMHDVTLESVAAVTDHFADAFIRNNVARVYMTLWRRNDVQKFDADAILFWEIKCKKMDI